MIDESAGSFHVAWSLQNHDHLSLIYFLFGHYLSNISVSSNITYVFVMTLLEISFMCDRHFNSLNIICMSDL